jgi:hypothetical protein
MNLALLSLTALKFVHQKGWNQGHLQCQHGISFKAARRTRTALPVISRKVSAVACSAVMVAARQVL